MIILYSLPILDSVKLNSNQSTIPTQATSNTTVLPTLPPSLFLTPIPSLPPTIVSTTSSPIVAISSPPSLSLSLSFSSSFSSSLSFYPQEHSVSGFVANLTHPMEIAASTLVLNYNIDLRILTIPLTITPRMYAQNVANVLILWSPIHHHQPLAGDQHYRQPYHHHQPYHYHQPYHHHLHYHQPYHHHQPLAEDQHHHQPLPFFRSRDQRILIHAVPKGNWWMIII